MGTRGDLMTIQIIIPRATTNLVQNPSFERGIDGYSAAAGGALSRVTSQQRYGVASAEYIPTAVIDDGLYYGPLSVGLGTQYVFSVDVLGEPGDRYRIYAYDVAAEITLTRTTDFVGTGEWERQSVVFVTGSNPSIRLYLVKNGDTSIAPFYSDAWQLEQSEETTYCDGDQPGCKWLAGPHTSASRRSGQSRAGGTIIDLSDLDVEVLELDGVGLTPRLHNVLPYATLPGAHLQSIKIMPRTINLVCVTNTQTETAMYSALSRLEAAVVHDRYAPMQPIRLRYTRAGRLVQLDCYYDSGLEGQFVEHVYTRFNIRFIAYENPYWYDIADTAVPLEISSSFENNFIFRYQDGRWSGVGPSAYPAGSSEIYSMAYDGGQRIYIAGAFTNWHGMGWDNLVYYDFVEDEYGSLGSPNDFLTHVSVRPNGNVLIAGYFIDIDGYSFRRVAEFDLAANHWTALGAGVGGTGAGPELTAAYLDTDGLFYIAGNIGPANIGQVWVWDGTAWTVLDSDFSGLATAVIVTLDGWIHLAGSFIAVDGVSAVRQARRDPDTGDWEPAGLGGSTNENDNAPIEAFMRGPDGLIYATGLDILHVGGVAVRGLTRWTGTQWQRVGGSSSFGATLTFDSRGMIWIAGSAAGIPFGELLARATLTNTLSVDLDLDQFDLGNEAASIIPVGDDIYVGLKAHGTHRTSGFTTITNESSVPVYPRFQFSRSGGTDAHLVLIRNNTTGDELFFDIHLQDGEQIVIDLSRPDKKITSSTRGDTLSYLPGSNVSSFRLLPGENEIAVFYVPDDSPTFEGFALWRNTYASVESAEA